ncbi:MULTISPECIES: hypothetical protein [Burkholderiaceae]|nr:MULTISPECIES: hypothetical protein [Burkholderiaceae]
MMTTEELSQDDINAPASRDALLDAAQRFIGRLSAGKSMLQS